MPAKNAAGAAPAAAPKGNNNNAKGGAGVGGEKAAASPKENQARGGGERGGRGGGAGGEKAGQPAAQGGQASQPQTAFPISSDPEKAAVQRKLNDIENTITKHRQEQEKVKAQFDAEKVHRESLITQQKKHKEDTAAFNKETGADREERQKLIQSKAELIHAQNISKDEAKKIRERLPTAPILVKAPAGAKEQKQGDKPERVERAEDHEAYLRKIDDDIRLLEKALASSAVSLQEEKKKVEQISQLQKAKKTYKEYVTLKEKIATDAKAIDGINKSLDEGKGKVAGEQRQQMREKGDAIHLQIVESRTKSDELLKQLNTCRERIDNDYTARSTIKKELDEVNKKIREREREEQRKAFEERERIRQKRREDYAAKEEKRAKEEELNTPYEYEMDTCKVLTDYLNSLLPKEEEEEAPAAAPATQNIEGATVLPKKEGIRDEAPKKKKKQQNKKVVDLRHNVSVFQQFEALSLAPPTKVADISSSVSELKAKHEYYSKLSADKIAARKEAAAAKAGGEEAQEQKTTTEEEAVAPATAD